MRSSTQIRVAGTNKVLLVGSFVTIEESSGMPPEGKSSIYTSTIFVRASLYHLEKIL